MTNLYWEIGEEIYKQQEQNGWGKSIVQVLSKELQKEFPGAKGYSTANLWRMRNFYLTYRDSEKLAPLVREISWSNNIIIMEKCKDDLQREFYIQMTKRYGWTIKIENNPVITTNISSSNTTSQMNEISFQKVKSDIMEIQGDIAELQDDLKSNTLEEFAIFEEQLEAIKNDLEAIEQLHSTQEMVKSGKLNKLKRFLSNFGDENSNERKFLEGAKNAALIIGGLITKYNSLAQNIGISQLHKC